MLRKTGIGKRQNIDPAEKNFADDVNKLLTKCDLMLNK
jgi:hypothetical protein